MKKILSAALLMALLLTLATSALAATGLGVVGTMTTTAATADAAGNVAGYIYLCAVTLDDEGKIVDVVFDATQPKGSFDATGAIVGEAVTDVVTKNEIKEGYGMKAISPIGKEWYEQTAAFCAFITGKTLNEAIAIAVNPAETDVATSCTIGTEDFLKLIVKAGL